MFVPVEEHRGTGIVEFVHGVEIGYLIDVHDVNDGKVLDLFGNVGEYLVLHHTSGVRIASETNDDDAVFFRDNGLIDFPAVVQMRDEIGHGHRKILKREEAEKEGLVSVTSEAVWLANATDLGLCERRLTRAGGIKVIYQIDMGLM